MKPAPWTAIHVDDEAASRQSVADMLARHFPEVELVYSASSVADALECLKKTEPRILILDIEMPGGTGFDLLEKLDQRPFSVIFHTAYTQYAIRAIKSSAVDYVLKPANEVEFREAIEKAKEHYTTWQAAASSEQLKVLRENLLAQSVRQIVIPHVGRQDVLQVDEIGYLQGEDNYTIFHLQSGRKVTASKPLKTYQEMLPENQFLRVHKSYVVNKNHLNRVSSGKSGQILHLKNGGEVPVSRRRWPIFKDALANLSG
jgi:two-component system LytT family response regulator